MTSTKNLTALALAIATFIPVAAQAQTNGNPAYLLDGAGRVVTNGSGECWRTGEWTPALATQPCDPSIKRVVAAPAEQPKQEEVAQVDATPPPMVVPVPVAVKALPQKVNFSADALFAFNKSALKPEGKIMLNDFVNQLTTMQYEQIEVTGHADRIGSAVYNQKLSERRATEVKNYLVSKNIPENRIIASGKGESQPMTVKGQCVGNGGAKVIACLQPDRRVDIEMKGTKG